MRSKETGRFLLGSVQAKLAAVRSPSTPELYWAAGIYEGEGSCYKGTTEYAFVSQKDPWLLYRLQELFGGRVGPHTWVRKDTNRPYTMYRWFASGARARGFLMTMYGLLSPRRQVQIRKCLGKENSIG